MKSNYMITVIGSKTLLHEENMQINNEKFLNMINNSDFFFVIYNIDMLKFHKIKKCLIKGTDRQTVSYGLNHKNRTEP